MSRNQRGFTLIEVMTVVAIAGILAAVAIPNYMKLRCKSKQAEPRMVLSGMFTSEKAFFAEYNTYGTDLVSVPWLPDGAPVYLYGFGSAFPAGTGSAVIRGINNWNGANDNSMMPSVINGGSSSARFSTAKMKDLSGAALSAASLPSTNCSIGSFIIGAVGDVDPDGATVQLDTWTINNTKVIANVLNDCSS